MHSSEYSGFRVVDYFWDTKYSNNLVQLPNYYDLRTLIASLNSMIYAEPNIKELKPAKVESGVVDRPLDVFETN